MLVVTGLPCSAADAATIMSTRWRFVKQTPFQPAVGLDCLLFCLVGALPNPTPEGETHAILEFTAVACYRN